MPIRNVNLTDELDRFVLKKVKSGRYENASEVVRAALRTLEREEQQYDARLAALSAAIDEADASGVAEGNVFARVRDTLAFADHRASVMPACRAGISLSIEKPLLVVAARKKSRS
jgi:antitoxin ParD1/3/4